MKLKQDPYRHPELLHITYHFMSTYTYVFNMLLIHVWCMMLYLNYIYITPALQVSLKHGVRTTEHVNVRPIWTIPVWRRNFSNSSTRPWRLGGSISVFKARQLIDYCRWLYYIILYYTILYYIILYYTNQYCILMYIGDYNKREIPVNQSQ